MKFGEMKGVGMVNKASAKSLKRVMQHVKRM